MRREAAGINFRYTADGAIGISVDETTTAEDASDIVTVFSGHVARQRVPPDEQVQRAASSPQLPRALLRTTPFLTHPVFNTHHSETKMMRYIRSLEREGRRPRHVDDSARLVHDEAECRIGDDPGNVASVLDACIRSSPVEQAAGYHQVFDGARTGALPDHRFRGGVAAAEFRRAG